MTPHTLQLLMPAVVVIGAGIILYKVSWREYPALISWMCLSVFIQGITFRGRPYPAWMVPVSAVFLTAWVSEAVWCSRIRIPRRRKLLVVGGAFLLAIAGVVFAELATPLTWPRRAYLLRSHLLIEAFAVLFAATLYRLARPVLECKRHLVYRIGATIWLCVSAVSGTFVFGGVGYRLFPYEQATRDAVMWWSYVATMLVIAGLAGGIAATVKRSKQVAKTGDGWLQSAGRKAA